LKIRDLVFLSLLTLGALLVHGYHPWVEDAEIYLPGVEKSLHPELFPSIQSLVRYQLATVARGFSK
jgi:hypothetical protein